VGSSRTCSDKNWHNSPNLLRFCNVISYANSRGFSDLHKSICF
jgi:hypothetical protein